MKKRKGRCVDYLQSNDNVFDQHITVIRSNVTSTFCLICKEIIFTGSNGVPTHVLSSGHQENLTKLFKLCVPDPLCDSLNTNCRKIIANSVFDLSLMLKNRISYIHQYENHIICLICRDILTRVTSTDSDEVVKCTLVSHLESEQHLSSIKDNVGWVYQFKETTGFVMFHKTILYCSVCEDKFWSTDTSLLQSVVRHLQTEHPAEADCSEAIGNTIGQNNKEDKLREIDSVGEISNSHVSQAFVEQCCGNIASNGSSLPKLTENSNDFVASDKKSKRRRRGKRNKKTHLSEINIETVQNDLVGPFVVTIESSAEFIFCTVCKEAIRDLTPESDIDSFVSTHLSDSKHKENTNLLFKLCVPDPLCDSNDKTYADIVRRSVLDLSSVLNNENTCVLKHENNLHCLICQVVISNITKSYNTVKYDLVYHFGTNLHLTKLREKGWWFYYLNTNRDFVAFHNFIDYCSICASILKCTPDSMLQCVVSHLQTEHKIFIDYNGEHTGHENNMENKIDGGCRSTLGGEVRSTLYADGSDLECCMLSLYSPEESNTGQCDEEFVISNNRVNVMSPITSPSQVPLNEFSSSINNIAATCSMSVELFELDCVTSQESNHLKKMENGEDVRNVNINKSLSDEISHTDKKKPEQADQGCIYTTENRLVCSECGEAIEIYNEDLEFSMDFHLSGHRDLFEINNCLDFENQKDDGEYTCPVCQEVILIFNNDIELSISLHGCQNNHNVDAKIPDVSLLFHELPDGFKAHQDFITTAGDDFFCKLCNCTLLSNSNFEAACKMLQSHISELYHKEKYDAHQKFIPPPVTNLKKKKDPWDLFCDDNDPETLEKIKSIIEENKQYIGKGKSYYFCEICKCCFLCFGNEQEMKRILASHFLCKNHKKKFLRYLNTVCTEGEINLPENNVVPSGDIGNHSLCQPPNSCKAKFSANDIFKKLQSLSGFQLNSQYFVPNDNTIFCKVCQIYITCDKTSALNKHCYSETHSMILVENASNHVAKLEKKCLLDNSDVGNERFIGVLKRVAENNYRKNDVTVTPNLIYIGSNGKSFVCLLCNMVIGFCENGLTLLHHFQRNIHKQKTYRLNCSDSSGNPGQEVQPTSVICDDGERPVANEEFVQEHCIEVSAYFNHLPEEYQLYRDFITLDGNNFFCQLCGCTLLSKKDFNVDCGILITHMSNTLHKDQYELSNKTLAPADCELDKDPWDLFDGNCDFETLLRIQTLVENNKKYIEEGNMFRMCTLCDLYFLYFDEQDIKKTLASHFLTEGHIRNVKRWSSRKSEKKSGLTNERVKSIGEKVDIVHVPKPSGESKNDVGSIIKEATKAPFVVRLNKPYFREKDGNFFCDLCQVFIEFTKNGSSIKRHCFLVPHNKILVENASNYFVDLDKKQDLQNPNENELKLRNILKEMAKTSYKQRNRTPIAHLMLISVESKNFVCLACNKVIRVKSRGNSSVTGHLESSKHAQNMYKLNCKSTTVESTLDTSLVNLEEINERSCVCREDSVVDDLYIQTIFNHLPQNLRVYSAFIKTDGENFICNLCTCKLPLPANMILADKLLEAHLLEPNHDNQYKLFKKEMEKNPCDMFQVDCKPPARIQSIIEENKQYIERGNVYYSCNVCKSYFLYFGVELDILETLSSHFLSKVHIKNVEGFGEVEQESIVTTNDDVIIDTETFNNVSFVEPPDVSVQKTNLKAVIKKFKKDPGIRLNKRYFREIGNRFYCDICQTFLDYDADGFNLVSHCYSSTHNTILIENSSNYLSNFGNLRQFKDLIEYSKSDESFRKVLSKLAEIYKHCDQKVAVPHLMLIKNKGMSFVCLLCNKWLVFRENGPSFLYLHINTKKHAQNMKLVHSNQLNCRKIDINADLEPTLGTDPALDGSIVQIQLPVNGSDGGGCNENTSETKNSFEGFSSSNDPNVIDESGSSEILIMQTSDHQARDSEDNDKYTTEQHFLKDSCGNCAELDTSIEPMVGYVEGLSESVDMTSKSDESVQLYFEVDNKALEVQSGDYLSDDSGCRIEESSPDESASCLTWQNVGIELSSVEFDENLDYVCPSCDELVTIYNQDINNSFQLHYKKHHSDVAELISSHKQDLCNKKFLTEVFDCLPESNQNYKDYISLQFDSLYCSLCKCYLATVKSDIFESAVLVHIHLSLNYHATQYELLQKRGSRSKFKPDVRILIPEGIPFDDNCFLRNKLAQNEMQVLSHNLVTDGVHFPEKCKNIAQSNVSVLDHEEYPMNNKNMSLDSLINNENQSLLNAGTKEKIFRNDSQSPIIKNVTGRNLRCSLPVEAAQDITQTSEEGATLPLRLMEEGILPDEVSGSKIASGIKAIFQNLPGNLIIHEEFFTVTRNIITCNLCSVSLKADDSQVREHIICITHKIEFLAEVKKKLSGDIKSQIKCLMFVNNQLYCSVCLCYITPWSNFNSLCQAVDSHLQNSAHQTSFDPSPKFTDRTERHEEAVSTSDMKGNLSQTEKMTFQTLKSSNQNLKKVLTQEEQINCEQNVTAKSAARTNNGEDTLKDPVMQKLKKYVVALEENSKFIIMHGSNYYCCLCDKGISYSPHRETLAKNFNRHLRSPSHEYFLKRLNSIEVQKKLMSALTN